MPDAFNIEAPRDNSIAGAGDAYARIMAAGAQDRARQAGITEQTLHAANMLQMAQAQQVAKGQTSTPQGGMGMSPITQSIMKAKSLATSSLDQSQLTDEQISTLKDMQNDPNVSYRDHLQAIEQLRQSQHAATQQNEFNTRQQSMASREQLAQQRAANKMQVQDIAKQMGSLRTAAHSSMGVDLDSDPDPQVAEPAQAQALRKQYAELKAKHDTLMEGAFTDQGNPPPGGNGDEDQQKGAEYKPGGAGGSKAMEQAGYARGTATITPVDKPSSSPSRQPPQDAEAQRRQEFGEFAGQAMAKYIGVPLAPKQGTPLTPEAVQAISKVAKTRQQAEQLAKQAGWAF